MTMRRTAFVLVVVATLLTAPAVANGQTYGEGTGTLDVSDAAISPGDVVEVSGDGCAASAGVSVRLVAASDGSSTSFAPTAADSTGAVSANIPIPESQPSGIYTLEAECLTADGATLVLGVQLSVGAAQLPFTGSEGVSAWFVSLGAVLIGAAIIVVADRRRRRLNLAE